MKQNQFFSKTVKHHEYESYKRDITHKGRSGAVLYSFLIMIMLSQFATMALV